MSIQRSLLVGARQSFLIFAVLMQWVIVGGEVHVSIVVTIVAAVMSGRILSILLAIMGLIMAFRKGITIVVGATIIGAMSILLVMSGI